MPTTLKKPNAAENDAEGKLNSPHNSQRQILPESPANLSDDSATSNSYTDLRNDLSKQEGEATTEAQPSNQSDHLSARESQGSFINNVGKLDKRDSQRGRFKKKSGLAAIFGSIALIFGIFFGGGIASGPLKLLKFGNLFQNPLAQQDENNRVRSGQLVRYWGSGDYGEFRLGILTSRTAKKALKQMKRNGIEIMKRNATGNVKSWKADSSRHPATKGKLMSVNQQRHAIAKAAGVPYESVKPIASSGSGGVASFEVITDYSVDANRKMTQTGTQSERGGLKGKIDSAAKGRALRKYIGNPRLFTSKYSKKGTHMKARAIGWAEEKEKKWKEDRQQRRMQRGLPADGRLSRGWQKAKGHLSPSFKARAGGGLMITGALCLVRNVAGSIAFANQAAIMNPAMNEAASYASSASEMQNGDMEFDDIEGEVSFLEDKDGSVFEAKAVRALDKPSPLDGEDIDPGYKNAFRTSDIESEIKNDIGGGLVGKFICSGPGIVAQMIAGISLTMASCSTVVGCGVAVGKLATSTYVQGLALSFLTPKIIDALVEEVDFEKLPKRQLGNVLAYGMRAGANMTAISSGGTELSETESRRAEVRYHKKIAKEEAAKPITERLFDTTNVESVASQVILKTNLSYKQPSQMAMGLSRTASLAASSLFQSFSSPALAAESLPSYDWGFPLFGIPQKVFDNESLQNPYENAKAVSDMLDKHAEENGGKDHKYIDRAMECFGSKISKTDEKWHAVMDEIVVPASKDYHQANCNDDTLEWRRVQMFVYDSKLADTMNCLESDDESSQESCNNIGMSEESASSESDPSEVASSEIDLGNLAKSSVNIACAPNTKDVGVHDGYTGGEKVKIRVCAVSNITSTSEESNGGYGVSGANGKLVVNSRVSGAVYNMVKAAKKDGVNLSAASGFRTMAHQQALCPCDGVTVAVPGTSNHQLGVAIDFGVGGVLMSAGSKEYQWLSENAGRFGYKPYSAEAWHWSPTGH